MSIDWHFKYLKVMARNILYWKGGLLEVAEPSESFWIFCALRQCRCFMFTMHESGCPYLSFNLWTINFIHTKPTTLLVDKINTSLWSNKSAIQCKEMIEIVYNMNWTIEQGCKTHQRVKSIMKIILRPYENNLFFFF